MSRLSRKQIDLELSEKGLIFTDDSPKYENLNSHIKVMCNRGHRFVTSLASVRLASFSCPVCVGDKTKGFDKMPTEVPEKKGQRIMGIDNATYNMGVSLFDDGKLVYFELVKFKSSDHVVRLNQIRDFFEDTVVKKWKPDIIQFEDVQHQNSYASYEVLIKLIGLLEMTADRFGIEYHKTRANV